MDEDHKPLSFFVDECLLEVDEDDKPLAAKRRSKHKAIVDEDHKLLIEQHNFGHCDGDDKPLAIFDEQEVRFSSGAQIGIWPCLLLDTLVATAVAVSRGWPLWTDTPGWCGWCVNGCSTLLALRSTVSLSSFECEVISVLPSFTVLTVSHFSFDLFYSVGRRSAMFWLPRYADGCGYRPEWDGFKNHCRAMKYWLDVN